MKVQYTVYHNIPNFYVVNPSNRRNAKLFTVKFLYPLLLVIVESDAVIVRFVSNGVEKLLSFYTPLSFTQNTFLNNLNN